VGSDYRYAEDLLRGLQAAAVNNKVPPRKAAYLFVPFYINRKGHHSRMVALSVTVTATFFYLQRTGLTLCLSRLVVVYVM